MSINNEFNSMKLYAALLFARIVVLSPPAFLFSACTLPRTPWTNHKPYRSDETVLDGGRVPVGIVEFDDQGEMWRKGDGSRTQLSRVLKRLREENAKGPVTLVIFVHGWNNNASKENADRGNLASFRSSLDALNKEVTHQRIFGVYVSWRGKSSTLASLLRYDYFKREGVAMKIGRVEATAALQSLCSEVHAHPSGRGRVIAVGHSMGGVILLRAMAQPLAADIAASAVTGRPVHPMADTTVLVNPADNAILARQFINVLRDYNVTYRSSNQDVPLITSITSEGDWATGPVYTGATRFSRYMLYWLTTPVGGQAHDAAQRKAVVNSIGRYRDIHSHTLQSLDPIESPNILNRFPAKKREFLSEAAARTDTKASVLKKNFGLGRHNGDLVVYLNPTDSNGQPTHRYIIQRLSKPLAGKGHLNRTPFWIMRVPRLVSRNHGDIWNSNFVGILGRLFEAPRTGSLRTGAPPRPEMRVSGP
jgi:pimeloyl-ACP methyl ester carboxylesterase